MIGKQLIKSIQSGDVTVEAFKRVRDDYKRELTDLRSNGIPNDGWFNKINELNASIEFCNSFLNHFETIKSGG